MRSLTFIALAAVTASSWAQRPAPVLVDPAQIETIRPTGWAPLDAQGNPRGGIHPYLGGGSARSASWKYAFDSMNSQSNSLPPTGTTPGTLQSLWVIPGNYKAYGWSNDVTALNAGTALGLAKGAYIAFHWNPNGSSPAAGTQNFAVKIFAAQTFDSTGNGPAYSQGLGGVMVTVANLAVGASPYKALPFDLSSVAGAIALPGGMSTANAASIVAQFGTYSGSDFVPFNPIVVCSPLFGNMLAPGEPRYPGVNESRSGEFYWADDSSTFTPTPNYNFEDFTNTAGAPFPFSELYSGDTEPDPTPANRHGIIQPAISLLIDQNMKSISGTLTFSDNENEALLPNLARMEIYDASGTNLLSTQTVALGSGQSYVIADPNPGSGGTYIVRYVQDSVWLCKRSGPVNTTANQNTVANLILTNGDMDMDNEVTLSDIDLVLAAYGQGGVGPLGGDLNLSDEVDLTDIDIAIASYGQGGE